MLRLGHVLRSGAQALVAEGRWRYPKSVDVACRQARRARQPDEERVQVGALARQVAHPQHRAHVAQTAAPRLGVARRFLHDPIVDGPGTGLVALDPGRDPVGGLTHDTVRGDQRGRRRPMRPCLRREGGMCLRRREIRRPVADGGFGDDVDHRSVFPLPDGVDETGIVVVTQQASLGSVRRPARLPGLGPIGCEDRGHRHPCLRGGPAGVDGDAGGDLEPAPRSGRGRVARGRAARQKREGDRCRGGGKHGPAGEGHSGAPDGQDDAAAVRCIRPPRKARGRLNPS